VANRLMARAAHQLPLRHASRSFITAPAATTTIDVAETWARLQDEARRAIDLSGGASFGLLGLIEKRVLAHSSLADGLSATIAGRLDADIDFKSMCTSAFAADSRLVDAAAADLDRFLAVDPAAEGLLRVYLFFKGFHAVQCARVAHHYWMQPGGGGRWLASALQSEMSASFGVDIHPASRWERVAPAEAQERFLREAASEARSDSGAPCRRVAQVGARHHHGPWHRMRHRRDSRDR
jgi:serine O-acetyltransferase